MAESIPFPLVSIIVPVFNNEAGLEKLLHSLAELEDPHFEVIVADDASRRPLPEFNFKFLQIVRLPENCGPAIARNRAVELSRGDILAFTDADCTVGRDWLTQIRGVLKDPSIQAVAGTFDDYSQPNSVTSLHYLGCVFYKIESGQFVHCFNTNCFAIRRRTFEAVGGFPDYRIGEDLMLGYGLQKVGIEVFWSDALRVKEAFRNTVGRYFSQQFLRSFAILKLYFSDSSIYFIKWPVRRNNLQFQLIATGLFWLSLFTAPLSSLWWLPVCGLGVLFSMNLEFLQFAYARIGFWKTLQVFALAISVRNVAWLLGSMWVVFSDPHLAWRGLSELGRRLCLRSLRDS